MYGRTFKQPSRQYHCLTLQPQLGKEVQEDVGAEKQREGQAVYGAPEEGGYRMLSAKASEVASREIPGAANDIRPDYPTEEDFFQRMMKRMPADSRPGPRPQ